ncbi:MAG TPA: single-stranded-DNA-specific exonuclease RecJ [Candidatus Limnocylindrales bacterium]|nr:single-stranded-DNA-specific exonuclease RecJ [Candidatus Limnocylindrales bacterium]
MIEPRFAWRVAEAVTPTVDLLEAGARLGLGLRAIGLLAGRGLTTVDELDAFFAEPMTALHDPRLLPDAEAFLTRLRAARSDGEKVMVFGDFDADGLTGLAILVRALRAWGMDPLPYVPSRLDEGHGLSDKALDAAREAGVTLIVTVDCGSTSLPEIAAARASGIDVLVTDHHRLPPVLPVALAVVNPQRADSRYPERRLAGSGVAFKLAQLLLADEPGGPAAALELCDLATIGSIADLVPILGETRAIVRLGLARIAARPRPGIAALLAAASVVPSAVDIETLSFAVAPRINAAGRVGESAAAAALLMTDDREEADRLAAELETANRTRRDLTSQAMGEARAAIAAIDPASIAGTGGLAAEAPADPVAIHATIVRGPWPVGIVGLVASRLVDDHGRPAIVGADLGDTIRASCRSDGRLDIAATLDACGPIFLRHGGHAGAAGFEIEAGRWPEFIATFDALAARAIPNDPRLPLAIDFALPALEVDYALHRDLRRLDPCGQGNPEPLLIVQGLTVTRVRAASGGHTQLTLRRRLDVLDGIAFGRPDLAETVHDGDRVDVVARLTSRTFGGYESLQLDIRDVASSGLHDAAWKLDARAVDGTPAVTGSLALPVAS